MLNLGWQFVSKLLVCGCCFREKDLSTLPVASTDDPVRAYLPSGLNATLKTKSVLPLKAFWARGSQRLDQGRIGLFGTGSFKGAYTEQNSCVSITGAARQYAIGLCRQAQRLIPRGAVLNLGRNRSKRHRNRRQGRVGVDYLAVGGILGCNRRTLGVIDRQRTLIRLIGLNQR